MTERVVKSHNLIPNLLPNSREKEKDERVGEGNGSSLV